ncbi:MAG: MerR family transcriptional regulator [Rhodospirillales bacterium]|nr:MerR family transcriptional regulator [Rhodospirillales bacterium]
MTEKSDNAFRTISEVADELDLPQHVLRFWETKFRQISPIKRGGGRRYYRPQDVELIRRIKSLLHTEGYTIKGVQRMLGQGGLHKLPEVPAAPAPAEIEAESETGRAMSASMAELAATLSELEQIRDFLKKSVA